MYVAEYFRFISNSGQIDIRLQIHEKKKKKQKTDKPTDLFWYSIVVYRNSRSFRLGKKRSYDQSHWPSDIIPPSFSRRAGGRESLCRFRFSLRRRLSARRMGVCRGPPWFSPPLEWSATPHDKVSIGNDSCFSHAHFNLTSHGLIGLHTFRWCREGVAICIITLPLAVAYWTNYCTSTYVDLARVPWGLPPRACLRSNRCRHWQGEGSEVCAGSFALLLCDCSMHGWFKVRNTQRWAGSSPPWNPTEARVNYAAQGMAAVRRNLFTMPLAIYAYVWTSTYVLMYVCTCTFSVLWEIRPAAPTCQPFSCGFDVRRDRLWVKYRGKRIIGTYPTKWVERGGNQERKKEEKKNRSKS